MRAEQQASADAAAKARAASDAAARAAADRLTAAARAAADRAYDEAAVALGEAVASARRTLTQTEDEVADDEVRTTLAAAVRTATAVLDKGDASPSELRRHARDLAAARTDARRAHEAWQAARERAATPTPRPTSSATPPSCRTTYDGPPFFTSPPTEGGDGSNGRLPASALAEVPWQPRDSQGNRFYLRTEAAAALGRLDAAFRQRFGHHLALDLAYRDYATQVAMRKALGAVAAVPGTSKHGTGTAIDVPELPCDYGYGTAEYRWLVANGPSYGWVQPAWAREGGSSPEYWHYEFVG